MSNYTDDDDDKDVQYHGDRGRNWRGRTLKARSTVKHAYFASIKFSPFEQNHEIKYMRIFGIAHHHKFIYVEYQQFCDVICNIFCNM